MTNISRLTALNAGLGDLYAATALVPCVFG